MVKKSFKQMEEQLAQERGMKTLYGGVLPDCPRTKLRGDIDAMKLLMMRDPMAKLKAYVEREGYRMIDLLKSFDKDNSFTISLEELKEGVKVRLVFVSVCVKVRFFSCQNQNLYVTKQ